MACLALGLALASGLSACGGDSGPGARQDADPGQPRSASAADQDPAGVTCPIVYDADDFARIQARGSAATLGFRAEALGPQIQCAGAAGGVRRGYSELSIFPKLRASGNARILPAEEDGQPEMLEVPLEAQPMTDDLKRSLGALLGARTTEEAAPATLIVGSAAPELALLGDLPGLPARIEPAQPDGTGLVARVSFMPGLESEVRALLPRLQAGTEALTLVSSRADRGALTEFVAFTVRRIGGAFDGEDGYSSADLAAELWNRARERDRPERTRVLEETSRWLSEMPVPRELALSRLGEMRDYARSLWRPAPSAAGVRPDNARDLLAALDLLGVLEPEDPTQPVATEAAAIRPFYADAPDSLLREAITLAETHPFTPAQRAVVLDTAQSLARSGLATSLGPWPEAKTLARGAGYDAARIQLALDVAQWLEEQGLPGTRPVDSSEDYVLARGLSVEQWELFRSVARWLRNGALPGGPEAVARTEDYVFQRHLTRVQAGALFEAFRWLIDYTGPNLSTDRALARAEDYVFARKLAYERLILLELTHSWLRDFPGPSLGNTDALARAESYVLDRGETAQALDLLKGAFSWLTSLAGPVMGVRDALPRAESYVFARGLTSARLARLEDLFRNLSQYLPRDQALKWAELQAL